MITPEKIDDDAEDNPMAQWEAARRRERAAALADAKAMQARLLCVARAAGAVRIHASYEGGADSGAIDNVAAEPEAADAILRDAVVACTAPTWAHALQAMIPQQVERSFASCVQEMFATLLEAQVGNWFDGDIETSGEIVWHVGEDPDRVTGEHSFVRRKSEWTEWSTEDDEDGEDGAASAVALPADSAGGEA